MLIPTARPVPACVPTGTGPAWPEHRTLDTAIRDFLAAARTSGMGEPAEFAPWTEDVTYVRDMRVSRRRPRTVGEVLRDSLDYSSGPDLNDVLALICRAADGKDIRAEAHVLLGRMAGVWAYHNDEGGDD